MWYDNFYTFENYNNSFPLNSGKSRDSLFVGSLIIRAMNDINALSNGTFRQGIDSNNLTLIQIDYIKEALGRIVYGYELNEFNFNDLTISLGQGGVSQSATVSSKNAQILDHILNQLRLAGLLANYKYLGEQDKPKEVYEGNLKEANENMVATFGDIKRSSLLLNGTNHPTNAIDFRGKELRNAVLVNPTIDNFKIDIAKKADTIFDPSTSTYEFIRDVKNLAFFGQERDNALTRAQVQNLVLASKLIWNAAIPYKKDSVVNYVTTGGELGNAVALKDNINVDPNVNTNNEWQILNTTIDIDYVVTQVLKDVEPKLEPLVDQELNKLPTINYKSEYKNQVIPFKNLDDFNAFKSETGTTDLDYEDVEVSSIGGDREWDFLEITLAVTRDGDIFIDDYKLYDKYDALLVTREYESRGAGICKIVNGFFDITNHYLQEQTFLTYSVTNNQFAFSTLEGRLIKFGSTNPDFKVRRFDKLLVWGRKRI